MARAAAASSAGAVGGDSSAMTLPRDVTRIRRPLRTFSRYAGRFCLSCVTFTSSMAGPLYRSTVQTHGTERQLEFPGLLPKKERGGAGRSWPARAAQGGETGSNAGTVALDDRRERREPVEVRRIAETVIREHRRELVLVA